MFQRIRNWLAGNSGLREATREATREAVREGMLEGVHLGIDDAIKTLIGNHQSTEPTLIESAASSLQLSEADLAGLRKPELIDLAEERGINHDGMTVPQLRDALLAQM